MTIMIVGEAFGQQEEEEGKPFVGASGQMLNGILRQVGIDRSDCILTNVFNFRPARNDIGTLFTSSAKDSVPGIVPMGRGKYLQRAYESSIRELRALRKSVNPNVIVALGNTALWALTHTVGIAKYRGSPTLTYDERHKVIPTWHPAAILRQWELRPVAVLDFQKIKREAEYPELRRRSRELWLAPTLENIKTFYERYIIPAPFLACDIETNSDQITEIGFAPSRDRAINIPFWARDKFGGNYWDTKRQELEAWEWVRRICKEKPLVGQNFQYDMQYLYRVMGITTPKMLGDTMLLHHSLQPELQKSLGFLGSIYTDEPAWKFMRTQSTTLKKED